MGLLSVKDFFDPLARRSGISFSVTTPSGQIVHAGDGDPAFHIRFHNRHAVTATLLRQHIGFLDAYFDQQIDIDGDLHAAFLAGTNSGFDVDPNLLNRLGNRRHEWRYSNASVAQAKANARAHYGLGADFYAMWLDDPFMMYTCGYWPEGTRTLEQAQQQKIDHVARKIRLSPDDTYVDIGCGFGGFMFRTAQTIGAQGVGVNTTTEQVAWLRDQIERRELSSSLTVREADFREVDRQYDKVVSIGVLEHAGRDQLAAVIRAHADFLKPGGLGMLHFIGHMGPRDTEYFIRKYVFPGGWIPSLADVLTEMERCGLEMVDIENLRRHYALTLDAWYERFERNWSAIHALDPQRFDERFRRIWRTYLLGCAEMFRARDTYTHLYQIVFSKGNVSRENYPMGRRFLYEATRSQSGDEAANADRVPQEEAARAADAAATRRLA